MSARFATRPHRHRVEPGELIDAPWVIAMLEEAGETLMALPNPGYSTLLRTNALVFLKAALDDAADARRAIPSSRAITEMDEALGWLLLIPDSHYRLRRVVGARMFISPVTGKPRYSWRRIGDMVGEHARSVQRWHADGIAFIVAGLNRRAVA